MRGPARFDRALLAPRLGIAFELAAAALIIGAVWIGVESMLVALAVAMGAIGIAWMLVSTWRAARGSAAAIGEILGGLGVAVGASGLFLIATGQEALPTSLMFGLPLILLGTATLVAGMVMRRRLLR